MFSLVLTLYPEFWSQGTFSFTYNLLGICTFIFRLFFFTVIVHYNRPVTYCRLSSSLAIISLLHEWSSCPDDILVRSHLNKSFLLPTLPRPTIDNFFHLPWVSSTSGRWQWCDWYVWFPAHCYLGYQPQAMLSCVYKRLALCCGICRKSILSSEQRSNIKKVCLF